MNEAEVRPLMKAVAAVLKEHLDGIRSALQKHRERLDTTDALVDDMEKRLASLEARERQP